jgi:hypothetical protein
MSEDHKEASQAAVLFRQAGIPAQDIPQATTEGALENIPLRNLQVDQATGVIPLPSPGIRSSSEHQMSGPPHNRNSNPSNPNA